MGTNNCRQFGSYFATGADCCYKDYTNTTSGCDDYITLTDATRNVNQGASPWYCDQSGRDVTSPGWKGDNWYRFTSGAGVMMPESSPGYRHCGTGLPGWLQGTHPTDINVPKQAKVCFH